MYLKSHLLFYELSGVMILSLGSCICDESALTGEATPVQKYYAPNTADIYQAEGHGSRHTLFSGTRVLQAGRRQQHDVLAIVAATGSIIFLEFSSSHECVVVSLMCTLFSVVCLS